MGVETSRRAAPAASLWPRTPPTPRTPPSSTAAAPVPAGVAASDDEAILAAAGQGDAERALDLLMAAYGDALFRYCRRLVVDPELAAEVHQTTFVQAYQALARFDRRSSLRTWLYAIAHHRALDALKIDRRRRRRFASMAEPPERPAPVPGAEERLTARAVAGLLGRCLAALDPRVRAAVLLRFQQEVSYPEMERLTGDRATTLQARVARALPVLRRCLERQGVTP